jgi:isopenicillin N synthase-like dioxygenase
MRREIHDMAPTGPIPVIDIAPFRTGTADGPAVVDAVAAACRDIGFFVVTGHGVPEATTRALYDGARAFFDRPADAKRAVGRTARRPGGVMYAALGAEALAATTGVKTPGDVKESLNFGPFLDGDDWPADLAGLHEAFAAYYAAMDDLARTMRAVFCRAIGLPPDHFEPAFVDHLSAVRVIDYPQQKAPPLPGQLRAGAHTDYGFITILRSEAADGGLQVRTRSGDWIDAPAVDGAFVINIGDALMRWTNDAWVSTPHRVANPASGAGSRRQSIPFFLNPRADTVIDCLPAFRADRPARYPPITYGDWIALKTKQAFG